MRCHRHGAAARERVANARYGRADARVVGDRSRIFLRYVQLGADEHALATHIDVRESFEIHCVPAVVLSGSENGSTKASHCRSRITSPTHSRLAAMSAGAIGRMTI